MDLLPLQSVLPKKVYLNNVIVGRQRDASFLVDGKKYKFSFTLPLVDYKPEVFFKIKLSDHILWLSLAQLPPLSYFSKKFEGVDLASLPEDIRSVVLEACFKNVLDIVEEEIGVVISIESFVHTHPGNNFDDELPFTVHIEGVELPVIGSLHMEGSSLEFLAALLERQSYIAKNQFGSVEIPLHVIIGEETLSLGEFKNLSLRDIVLLNDDKFINDGSCKVVVGNHLMYDGVLKNGILTLGNLMDERVNNEGLDQDASYELEDEETEDFDVEVEEGPEEKEPSSGGTVLSEVKKEPEDQDEEDDEDVGQETPRELADLPIRVVFEVGQKRLALKDLQSLKEGYTFELESPVDRPVTIRANGKVIGAGELLKVGERVGVRVTSFSSK